MLHLLAEHSTESRPQPYAEAVSRLASVRHALRLVDTLGDGPSPDEDDAMLASAWDEAGEARQRCFDRRSARLVGTTATALEALLDERHKGREPNAEASQMLVDQIRREL